MRPPPKRKAALAGAAPEKTNDDDLSTDTENRKSIRSTPENDGDPADEVYRKPLVPSGGDDGCDTTPTGPRQLSRNTFNFKQDFQDLILACVLKRPEFAKYAAVISPKYFSGSVSTVTARTIFDYHKKRQAFPTKEVLTQLVADRAKKDGEDADTLHEYVNKIFKIKTVKVWEEVVEKVIFFCHERAVLHALTLSVDHFKEGTQPEGGYVKLFTDATAVGTEFTDLDLFKFDPERVIEKPEPVLRLTGHTMATPGNLMTVSGRPKSGKSGVVSAVIAALVAEPGSVGDRLGFEGHNPDRKAVLHLDTEQSRYDHQSLVEVALERAGGVSPKHLHSYSCASFNVEARLSALRNRMRELHEEGGLRAALIDGIGDFCYDPNDSKEAFALVDELHRLAAKYNTIIVLVLHENPTGKGDASGKTRGHLGSQLERKSETNLRLKKNGEGVTVLFSDNSRHAYIPESCGPCFRWDDEVGMHVACESVRETKVAAKSAATQDMIEEIFAGKASLSYTALRGEVMRVRGVKERAAETAIKKLIPGYVVKNATGEYEAA